MEYSVEAFDWDWASFHKNILLPNRMHIRSVMQLSDTITDRVVYSVHFLLNEWNGDDDEENDEDVNVRFDSGRPRLLMWCTPTCSEKVEPTNLSNT